MQKLKIDQKLGIIFCGSGSRRAALDFTSGIIFAAKNPGVTLATFERDGWLMPSQPKYSRGGWGRSGSGDADGNALWENALMLLKACRARVNGVNISALTALDELERMQKLSAKMALLESEAKKHGLTKDLQIDFKYSGDRLQKYSLAGKINRYSGYRSHGMRGENPLELVARLEKAVGVFIEGRGKPVRVGEYRVEPKLVTQNGVTVALRDEAGNVVMNSQVLALTAFEWTFLGGESLVQNAIKKIAKYSIPFNVLASAGLRLNETKIVENGPEETFTIDGESRHFTGALLLENAGRRFLMDVDRIEIGHGIFNAFFVEVTPQVTSIAEAYESMKPQEVKDAESAGVKVLRQGEWFFIPTAKTVTVPRGSIKSWMPQGRELEESPQGVTRKSISHGKGRPNALFTPFGFGELDELVCGFVSHTGREHKTLSLGVYTEDAKDVLEGTMQRTWGENTPDDKITFDLWRVIGNTTVSNFTIQGAVD